MFFKMGLNCIYTQPPIQHKVVFDTTKQLLQQHIKNSPQQAEYEDYLLRPSKASQPQHLFGRSNGST